MIKALTSWIWASRSKSKSENPFRAQQFFFHKQDKLTIFDVGAYIGRTSKMYRRIFPNATIYSFEPFPDSFEKLRKLAATGLITPYQLAFSDRSGRTKLYVSSDPSCNSFFPRPKSGTKYYPDKARNTSQIQVETISIDGFCSEKNIPAIDILKLDVEGAEIKVLNGAAAKLAKQSVELIYTEVMFVAHYDGGCIFHELSSFLSRHGYTLFNIYNLKCARDGQLRWGNAIFLSPQIRARINSASAL